MIKIKVSYQDQGELEKLLSLLKNSTDKVKLSKNDKGQYKKAYIILKEHF